MPFATFDLKWQGELWYAPHPQPQGPQMSSGCQSIAGTPQELLYSEDTDRRYRFPATFPLCCHRKKLCCSPVH